VNQARPTLAYESHPSPERARLSDGQVVWLLAALTLALCVVGIAVLFVTVFWSVGFGP
jgi:hypothetical protein